MRRFLAVPLSLCLACASTPDAYRRGATAPARPATTYTPAGAGANDAGQPGDQPMHRRVNRSDNTSIKPPSAQHELYAADGDDFRAVQLMLTAPVAGVPEGIAPKAYERCWEDFKSMARKDERFMRLSHAEAKCLRTLILNHCGARMIEAADKGDASFLARFPPQPGSQTGGPRGRRTMGTYNQREFEEATAGRRNQRECGREHTFWTDRVSDLLRSMTRHGDDVIGWRNP